MNRTDFLALAPLLVLSLAAVMLMLLIAWRRQAGTSGLLATAGFVAAALACAPAARVAPLAVGALLRVDGWALTFCVLFCLAGAVTALLSTRYIRHHGDQPEEFFLLLLLATLGACVLACATHLAALLLGLELLSISLYGLIAYPTRSLLSLEAAVKYLVLSGAASATLLFGFALLYAVAGTLEFNELGRALARVDVGGILVVTGAAMVFAGLAFKLSLVPFHLWTPDVYDGAPAPVTGFLASVGKAAVLALLLRLYIDADLFRYRGLVELTAVVALLSMLAGNLLALLQSNLKRILAYSSIAHMGYLLILFTVCHDTGGQDLAREAAAYYLIAYTATTLAAFGLLTQVNEGRDEREQVQLQQLAGLFWRQPLLAILLLAALLSLAGIPLTAGFIAKFYLFTAAAMGGHWLLLAGLIAGSGIGVYYYLRVVYYMARDPEDYGDAESLTVSWRGGILSCLLIAAILLPGIFPQPLMAYLKAILQG